MRRDTLSFLRSLPYKKNIVTLKTRLDRLVQRRPSQVLLIGGLPDDALPMLPDMPRQPGETHEQWTARLHAEAARLYPHAPLVIYPQFRAET